MNLKKLLLFMFILPAACFANIKVGVGQRDITPPIGTPSAGSFEREGTMKGIHDPLLAIAMVVDNGEKLVAFCCVDHMGFLHEMVEAVKQQVHSHPALSKCEIFMGSTHTHSGGGAYIDLPGLGDLIAGPYDAHLVKIAVDGAAEAIIEAGVNLQPAKIGIGYGQLKGLTTYGGVFPKDLDPPSDLTVIKVTKLEGSPLAVFFNYALYPDVLGNTDAFSADVVGYTRNHIKSLLGNQIAPLFFNGAKGELLTKILFPDDRHKSCDAIGKTLAQSVAHVWNSTQVQNNIKITTLKHSYTFDPKPTPSGFVLPIEKYLTEINLIALDKVHAFVTIPAELSCSLDPVFKSKALQMGFKHLSILDLVNDAHGYIYSPESWRQGPEEVEFSWGGEMYGQIMQNKIFDLLIQIAPGN